MKRTTIKSDHFRNKYGAYFEKDAESVEGYYHFCDGLIREYVPVIWRHDIHTFLIQNDNSRMYIKFCPLCGKQLD